MNQQQIAAVYDSLPEDKQDMPRDQFIKQVMSAIDPDKIANEANTIARGRIQKAQIDAALRRDAKDIAQGRVRKCCR